MGREEIILGELKNSILNYDEERAKELANKALEEGVDPLKAVEEGLAEGIREVGDKFTREEVFLPHLMVAAETMKSALEILNPEIRKRGKKIKTKGTVILGTIEGDLHDIGKSIVAMMLEISGFTVYDLGRDVLIDDFIEKAKEVNADIIGVSALMTTTMQGQKRLIDRLKEQNLLGNYKIMIGGAAVSEEWANKIQADAYAEDAIEAVNKAESLMNL
jgi:trimethylamine corrinoid protein